MTKAWIKGISGSIFKIYRLIFLFVIRMAFETWHPLLQILERCEKRYGKKILGHIFNAYSVAKLIEALKEEANNYN